MPQVARTREAPEAFAREREQLGGRFVLLATLMSLGFCVAGPIFAPLLYGHAFAQPLPMFAALALLQGLRLARFWPTTIALGTGDSLTVLANNLVRMVALPLSLSAYAIWPSVYAIVGGFVVGEFLALLTALGLLWRRRIVVARRELVRTLLFTLVGTLALVTSAAAEQGKWTLAALACAATFGAVMAQAWTERLTLLHAWALFRARIPRRA